MGYKAPVNWKEKEGEEDTEAGIHVRISETGGEAGEIWADSGRGSEGTVSDRADPAQLGQGIRRGQAQRSRHEAGHAGADGTLPGACRESAAQAGE